VLLAPGVYVLNDTSYPLGSPFLNFPNGEPNFFSKKRKRKSFHFKIDFKIQGLTNVALAGADPENPALLIVGTLHAAVAFYGATNIAFQNLQFDMERVAFTYGVVQSVEASSFTLTFDETVYPFYTGSEFTWLYSVQSILQYDPVNNRSAVNAVDIYCTSDPVPLQIVEAGLLSVQGYGSDQGIHVGM
jgi:hypothetical protein